jgi:DNA-binding protein YbaB
MDPEKWFAQYDEKLKAAAASANKAEQALKEVGGSATSQDGDVTVRVTANGGLSDLVLRPGVSDLEPEQLDAVREYLPQGFTNDGRDNPMDLVQRGERKPRSDDEYFDSPPEVIKEY